MDVESIVSVAVTAEVPAIIVLAAAHPGTDTAFAGAVVTEQLKTTDPVNPATGATVTVESPDSPGLAIVTFAALFSWKPGADSPVTETPTAVEVEVA